MKIYQLVTSPFAVRVRIALNAKGVTTEFMAPPGGIGSEAFRKITPMGKVPTLVCDDGTVIAESAVINEYLDEQFPDLPCLSVSRALFTPSPPFATPNIAVRDSTTHRTSTARPNPSISAL